MATQLHIKPIVLETFRKAHPKPTSSARQLLEKYVSVLQDEISKAKQRKRTAFEVKAGLYHFNASRLTNEGGQFGKKGKRVHTWLGENGLDLIEFKTKANSFNKGLSVVKLTDLVFEFEFENEIAATEQELVNCITTTESSALKLAKSYEQQVQHMNEFEFETEFDVTPVNARSLQNYIDWLDAGVNLDMTDESRLRKLNQAQHIKTVSDYFDGKFVQRKIASEFGRTYYEGTSVQNIGKDTRRAMLGNCWEYDIHSSVVAWKMKFADEFLQSTGCTATVEQAFRTSIWYLTGKNELMQRIQEQTFLANSNVGLDLQPKLIKRAMTAICFGARKEQGGWRLKTGEWFTPALASIIKNKNERKRFADCVYVREFVQEQNSLDTYLKDQIEAIRPTLLENKLLHTHGRANKAKVVAWLYQKSETQTMAHVYEYLGNKGIEVIAKVHDAFFIKRKLSSEVRQELEIEIETLTGMSYFRFGETKIEQWNAALTREEHERVQAHKRFMANELELMRAKQKNAVCI